MDDKDLLLATLTPTSVGPYWDVIDAPSWNNKNEIVRLGVRVESFRIAQKTGTAVAQYFYIVRLGLLQAVHLFRGVNRRMKYREDMNADASILAYVWRPEFDFEWVGGPHSHAFPKKLIPPPLLVFVVLVRPYAKPDEYNVSGSILKWNWVDGDFNAKPIDMEDRYSETIWSKGV